ncbi:MFS transporter [Vibrio sp. Isolate25]|uniref:MFS transporter n=1 Tax=Vibrio sp. Isolate25 TaxID=2908535 RepID=UPI001EFCC8BA|nr:MFS transporter [Vibrio sp. Isolate25]MCG9597372.1 MFS transporter [Vibrio sp. Isolate25]
MDTGYMVKAQRFISLRAKLILAIVAVLLFSNGLNTTLNYLNFDKRLTQTSDSTYQVVLDETDNDIRQAMSLGLPLSSISNIQSLIERRLELVDGISKIQVVNSSDDVLFTTGVAKFDTDRLLTTDIVNTFNVKEGELRLYYSPLYLEQIKQTLLSQQVMDTLLWVLVAAVIGYLALNSLLDFLLKKVKSATNAMNTEGMTEKQLLTSVKSHIIADRTSSKWNKIRAKYFPLLIILLAIVLTVASNLGSSYQSLNKFSVVYENQLKQKSNLIGDTLSHMIGRIINEGVPLERLMGLEDEFSSYIEHHPELLSIRLERNETALYQHPDFFPDYVEASELSIPIDTTGIIKLQMMADTNIIPQMIKDSIMDMITVLVASGLFVIEIILFICHFMIIKPWRQIKQLIAMGEHKQVPYLVKVQSNDELGSLIGKLNALIKSTFDSKALPEKNIQDYRFVRLPLFILIFSEAASLAFFPNFVASLPSTQNWIPTDLVTSLPISLFMLCWALSLPFAGYWSDKVGRRKSLIGGGLLTAVGLVATALSPNLELLLVARAVTAVGYGIVFISAQGYVTDTTNTQNRTKGMSTFLSAFFSGSLCGAAIGGVLADKLGYSMTFMLAASLAIVGVMLVIIFFDRGETNSESKPVQLTDFKILLSNKYFALITFFSAIPAKVVLTGFLYYICPVYLQSLGESSAVSGRVMMTYGLAIIIISPLAASLVDKWNNKIAFIFAGGILSAAALINIMMLPGTFGLLMIVILVGIAHGLCVSPQVPLIIELLSGSGLDKGKTIGIFRLTERIGNIAGPLVAGLALSVLGFQSTIMLFGVALLISSIVLLSFYSLFVRRDRNQVEVVK